MLRMRRFTAPLMASMLADQHCSCDAGTTAARRSRCAAPAGGVSSASTASALSSSSSSAVSHLAMQRRFLKAHDVREYKPLGMPVEMRFYQRHTTHPARQSGVQFLTHYEDHRRWNIRRDFIDYMNWGREQGQAHLPHRHNRVAFDFNDAVHPTALPRGATAGQFEGQDPSFADGAHPSLSSTFDRNKVLFSTPTHMNRAYSELLPGDVRVRVLRDRPLDAKGLDGRAMGMTTVEGKGDGFMGHLPATNYAFGNASTIPWGRENYPIDQVGFVPGRVPGVNAPFRGETDGQHMQAMSQPLTEDNRVTGNDGRFSKTLYMNYPERDNVLTTSLAKDLNEQIDMATNAAYSKLVVLKGAQSGLTDKFSAGMDIEQYSYDLAMAAKYEAEANAFGAEMAAEKAADKTGNKNNTNTKIASLAAKRVSRLDLAARHRRRVDEGLRSQAALLWRTFTAPRPLMTFVNGRCHNTACGLALLAKFPALRDSTELIVDGPTFGLTPYGAMTNLLARPETAGKMPGLAEFTVLTSNALYAGDALSLGWTDLFTTFQDMDYHIKDWFNATEHMHNDAIAWQLGQLLDSCFRMKDHHSTALERRAVTPVRARWIEDAFADQPSVEAIVRTLSVMEKLPTGPSPAAAAEAGNGFDVGTVTPYSLYDVEAGISKLSKNNLHFALAPWDITPLAADGGAAGFTESGEALETVDGDKVKSNFASIFTNYVFERDAKGREVAVLKRADRARMRAWRKQRYQEYNDYVAMVNAPVKRHVFARVEGCDGKLVDFEFFFDRTKAAAEAAAAAGTTASATPSSDDDAMLKSVLREVAAKMGYDPARPLELGWYLPTLDTARIRTDDELVKVLQNDPGFEAPSDTHQTVHPPVYFIVKRPTIHMSEWAYATKHQLLLASPFALKASFQLLADVRNGRRPTAAAKTNNSNATELEVAEASIQSISETLATEFRYISRLVRRPDFYATGYNATRTMDQWEQLEADKAVHLHLSDQPTHRPAVDFEEVFERDVTVDGHKFLLRPRWSPATLEEVPDAAIEALRAPLDFEADAGLTEIHVPTYTNKADRIAASINDIGGFEVVPGLGDKTDGAAAPLVADAHVPTNVNFYVMARHPWTDQANSWRQDTFTDASLEYMKNKYDDALQQINRGANTASSSSSEANGGGRQQVMRSNYWPSKADVEGDGKFEAEEEALLKDRLYNAVDAASNKVEEWASTLRTAAQKQSLEYKIEITSQQERFYDDNYYRWFVRPGEHPNPSGLLRDGKAVSAGGSSGSEGDAIDPEALMASFEENFSMDSSPAPEE